MAHARRAHTLPGSTHTLRIGRADGERVVCEDTSNVPRRSANSADRLGGQQRNAPLQPVWHKG